MKRSTKRTKRSSGERTTPDLTSGSDPRLPSRSEVGAPGAPSRAHGTVLQQQEASAPVDPDFEERFNKLRNAMNGHFK
jgi:hypothetical protein